MNKIVSSVIVPRITDYTGIRISPIHEKSLQLHIEKMATENEMTFEQYCELLVPSTKEFEALINVATTNETYFFREKIQFEFLRDKVFPTFLGKKVTIWSGACASGEEPISLYSLAVSCGVKPEIHASDIDSNELSYFKNGIYTKYSLNQDGKEFHHLLEETNTGKFQDEKFHLNNHVFQSIKIHQYNLANKILPDFFEKADIIFLRNVFIYFDNELRKEILEKAAQKLVPGGIIFLSVGEICCVGQDLVPSCLEKKNYGKVYYFVKSGGENLLLKSLLVDKSQKAEHNLEDIAKLIHKRIESKQEREAQEENKDTSFQESISISVETRKPWEVFSKVNMFLSQKKSEEALDYLQNYNPGFSEKFYKEYFFALVYKAIDNNEEAIKHFAISETICSTFWPSYFYHGMVLKNQGKESAAKRCFEKCMSCLENYINSKNQDYDFLTESFSPTYFFTLCKKYVTGGN